MSSSCEEALFILALSKPGAERTAWLDLECVGDPVLRARLEALLAAHEQPDGLRATQSEAQRPTIKLANGDQTIKLWDTKNWTVAATLRGHEFEIWSVAFSPDGKRLISSGKDDTIRVWRTEPVLKRLEMAFREYTPWLVSKEGSNSTLVTVNRDT